MKAKQLRELLANIPDDAVVHLAVPTHNYIGTVLAVPVRDLGVAQAREGGYGNEKRVRDPHDDEDSESDREFTEVYLIR